MRLLALLLAAAAAAGRAGHTAAQQAGACLRYGPDTVRVSGTLRRLTFPGPPNFVDVRTGDAPETGYYLDLPAPVCVAGGRDEELGGPRSGVRQLQLVVDSAGYAALRPSLGRRVTLQGTLFPSHTGHHHAPVLLDVLRPARAGTP